jgi:hypothetical protein
MALIVSVSGGSLSVLRTWIKAQTEQKKSFLIRFNGMTFQGYSPDDMEHLLASIGEIIVPSDAAADAVDND